MARKKKIKTKVLNVRLYDESWRKIETYCKRMGITKTEWVETMARQCVKPIKSNKGGF